MSEELDRSKINEVVESLWNGLDEDSKIGFEGYKIEERPSLSRGSETPPLTIADKGTDGKLYLFVYQNSIVNLVKADPRIAWRPFLAKAMRKAIVAYRTSQGVVEEPCKKTARSSVSGTKPPYIHTQERTSIPPSWAAPPPQRVSKPPSVESSFSSLKEGRFWKLWPVRFLFAPAVAAFRHRKTESTLQSSLLWMWRIATILSYLATISGVLYIIYLGISGWQYAGATVSSENTEQTDPEDNFGLNTAEVQPITAMEAHGYRWLIPSGWSVEAGDSDSILIAYGPAQSSVGIIRLDENFDGSTQSKVRACIGRREAHVARGGSGLEYIDGRYIYQSEIWHVRCVFQEGYLIRAQAPVTVFMGEHLREWLLLFVLDQQILLREGASLNDFILPSEQEPTTSIVDADSPGPPNLDADLVEGESKTP